MTVASTSIAAHRVIKSSALFSTLTAEVEEVIRAAGARGLTMDEVAALMPEEFRQHSTLSGRFNQLENEGAIFRMGDTRPGKSGRQQLIMRHRDFAHDPTLLLIKPRKMKKTAFMAGLMYAARIVAEAPDMAAAKTRLRDALIKTAKKSPAGA